jgi:ABC-type branched-subunit amino acid transport system permease subunit
VTRDRWRRWLLGLQAGYYAITGIWPLVHLPSFEAVTGPKIDDWLVHMVGLLAAAIGIPIGIAAVRNRGRLTEVVVLAVTSALAFAAIDLWYGLTGRISPIYLADAGVQLGLIAGLGLTHRIDSVD